MRTRQLEWMEPMEAARRLAGLPGLAFLDSALPHPRLGRFSYVAADPFGCFTVDDGVARWDGEREDAPSLGASSASAALSALRRRLARYPQRNLPDLPPFQGGAVGSIAYEFGRALEEDGVPRATRDIHLGFYDVLLAFDHVEQRCCLLASGHPAGTVDARRARAEARLDQFASGLAEPLSPAGAAPRLAWASTAPPERFTDAVVRVKAHIRDGDIYQANVARRLRAPLPSGADMLALYAALRGANPAPFAAFFAQDARTILSTSPELFLRTDGRSVETRPIKGTARRHADAAADAAAAVALAASRKDRAENVMIVDLMRNDLARVCLPASVAVPELCAVETYAGLHHLVSSVTGVLREDCDTLDLLAASFPGGSITGAPKPRAMDIIAALEERPRGVYCGALGFVGFDGSMGLNIAIRTVVAENGAAELGVGGGITLLSDPAEELEETAVKARRIIAATAP